MKQLTSLVLSEYHKKAADNVNVLLYRGWMNHHSYDAKGAFHFDEEAMSEPVRERWRISSGVLINVMLQRKEITNLQYKQELWKEPFHIPMID